MHAPQYYITYKIFIVVIMNINVPANKVKPLPFRVEKFDYNRYYIDHPVIKGVLNVGNLLNNVGKIPDDMIPPNKMPPEGIVVGLSFQSVVSFTNYGERHVGSKKLPLPQEMAKMKKQELTNYLVQEENHEPWNHYVLSNAPQKLLKTRTMLLKVEWLVDYYNNLGDPYLLVNHNTSHSISNIDSPGLDMR